MSPTPTWRIFQQRCEQFEAKKAADGTFCDWLDSLAAYTPPCSPQTCGHGEALTGAR